MHPHTVRLRAASCVCFAALTLSAAPASAGSLLVEDFNTAARVRLTALESPVATPSTVALTDHGTIDAYMGSPTPCATLTTAAGGGIAVGPFSVVNAETDLARLTLGFDLWTDGVRPVRVTLESLDEQGGVTGALASTVHPPAPAAWFRHTLDLNAPTATTGKFDPKAKSVRITFDLEASRDAGESTVRIDNLSYTAPSFYVSEKGSDAADGRTESSPFATIQRAIDAAAPGDVILIMDGTYRNASSAGLATIAKAGAPAGWIVIRPRPGHRPELVNDGWEAFKITHGAAYIELRGLTVRGNRANVALDAATADGLLKEKDGKPYPGNPIFNGNGISIDGRKSPTPELQPHHLRVVGNHVYDHCGTGVSAIAADYIAFVGNHIHDNSHFTRYGCSGVSILIPSNFDHGAAHKTFILGNVAHHNRCYVPWEHVGKISDGNGIIADVNVRKENAELTYRGRTLIANNVSYANGGGGVTVTTSRGVDVIHNTLYHNVQSPELAKAGWGDLFIGGPKPGSHDVRAMNNIVVAAPGRAILHAHTTTGLFSASNLLLGDAGAKVSVGDAGDTANLVADPAFVAASTDPSVADFRLQSHSPAIDSAAAEAFPEVDKDGSSRTDPGPADRGAIEYQAEK